MSTSPVKSISYVCNECKKSRLFNVNRDYHIARSAGGLTVYNDYHICRDEQFSPSILSVDRQFSVRTQKSIASSSYTLQIPAPSIANSQLELLDPETFSEVFDTIKVISEILKIEYTYGTGTDNLESKVSPSGVYEIKYRLTPEFTIYEDRVKERIGQFLYALDVGQTINNSIISVIISFIAEHASLRADYVDQEIVIDMTKAEKIWMKWTSQFVPRYVDRHVSRLFGTGGLNIAKTIIPYLSTGEYSMYEVSELSAIDLASTISIAFMMELWGILEYVYKD